MIPILMSTPSQQNRSSKDHTGQSTIGPLLESVSRKPKFLRLLYNHTGDSEQEHDTIAAFLLAHGYRLAPCTIDNTDYKFDETYVLAPARQLARASVAASFRGGSAFSISLVFSISTRTKVHGLQCRRRHLACNEGEIRAHDSYPCLLLSGILAGEITGEIRDPGIGILPSYPLFGINDRCTLVNGQTVPVFPAP